REAPIEVTAVLSGIVSKTAVFGFLRIALPKFPEPVHDLRGLIVVLSGAALVYGSVLAVRTWDLRGIVAYSSLAQMGLITLGSFAANDLGLDGAVLQSVNHALISASMFLLVGMVERRSGTGDIGALGGMARGRPVLATVLLVAGMVALAVPGSATFAGEFLIMAGVYGQSWGYAVVVALGVVLAAMYVLRLISAVLHVRPGSAVREEALDLRLGELALVLPLVSCLLVLSFWPALVSQSAFAGDAAAKVLRHGLLRERGEPDDAVPGARVVLALPLCPRRHRHRPGDLARGRPEVRDRGRLRLGGAALRLGARLRGDRQARLLGDRGGERVER